MMISCDLSTGRQHQTDAVITVLLVDDHVIFRSGIKAILSAHHDMSVVGEASDGIEALERVKAFRPRVVLMDIEMPGGDGIAATLAISRLVNPPMVLILTMHSEEDRLVSLISSGASGFLSKDAEPEHLLRAIRAVAAGDMYIRPEAATILAARIHSPPSRSLFDEARSKISKLSERELEVLLLIAEGYNSPEIGGRIGISPKTVETYKHRISEKIGLDHRADYVSFALTAEMMSRSPRDR